MELNGEIDMTKYYGVIGFVETVETSPGVYSEKTTEKSYKGDVVRNYKRWESRTDSTNDNLVINNSISIVADDYCISHSPYIRYASYMGSYWKVSSIDLSQRPRVILELGGVYERNIEYEDSEDPTPDDSGEDTGI